MKALFKKLLNRETITYLVFGVLTTLVSWGALWLTERLHIHYLLGNILSWILAVAFAFVTNKQYVFCSRDWSAKTVFSEGTRFAGSRLTTLGVEEAGLWLMVSILHWPVMLSKILLAVVVVILNYILSKLLVFMGKGEKDHGNS